MPTNVSKGIASLLGEPYQHSSWRTHRAWMIITSSPEGFNSTRELAPTSAQMVLQCFVIGQNWKTQSTFDGQHAGKTSRQAEQSL